MKSILIISTEFPPAPGGIGSHAFALANELTKLNWKVIAATEQNYTTQIEIDTFNQSQDFPIYQLQPTPSLFSLVRKTFLNVVIHCLEKALQMVFLVPVLIVRLIRSYDKWYL
jgi:hypothetical protein